MKDFLIETLKFVGLCAASFLLCCVFIALLGLVLPPAAPLAVTVV